MNANEPDTVSAEPDAAAPAPAIDPLTAAQAEAAKFRDLALRNQADLENYRKRAAREREEAVRYSNQSLIEDLLPVLDNFELGLEAARAGGGDAGAILKGMDMVLRQVADFLQKAGVQSIEAAGTPFDPNLHQAISQEASADQPEGTVLRQLRKGYKLKDRLLRPANVIVSRGAVEPGEASGGSASQGS